MQWQTFEFTVQSHFKAAIHDTFGIKMYRACSFQFVNMYWNDSVCVLTNVDIFGAGSYSLSWKALYINLVSNSTVLAAGQQL